jgi:hypothetical protein
MLVHQHSRVGWCNSQASGQSLCPLPVLDCENALLVAVPDGTMRDLSRTEWGGASLDGEGQVRVARLIRL